MKPTLPLRELQGVVQQRAENDRRVKGIQAVLKRPESDPTRRRVVELLDRARARKEAAELG